MNFFEKSLIIDVRSSSGFFSNYCIFLDNLKYCLDNNIKPIFKLESDWFYNDGRENLWESFFQSINDGIIIGNSEKSNFFKLWDENFLVRQGKVMVWENYNNQDELKKNRLEVNKIVSILKPNTYIQSIVDDFVNKNFLNKKIIGVHIRGTDYKFYHLDLYVKQIKKYYKDFDMIYVASDNEESINHIKNNFDNVISYQTDIRAKNINDNVLCSNLSNDKKVKHGQDVFVECILLSKCEHLICINSNVAAVSLYMNPNMSFDLVCRVRDGG
jgi:hypothetical protein